MNESMPVTWTGPQLSQRWGTAVLIAVFQLVAAAAVFAVAGFIREEFGRVVLGSRFVLEAFLGGIALGLLTTGLLCAAGAAYLGLLHSRPARVVAADGLVLLAMRASIGGVEGPAQASVKTRARAKLPHYMAATFTDKSFGVWDGGKEPFYSVSWRDVGSVDVREAGRFPRKFALSILDDHGVELVAVIPLSLSNPFAFCGDLELLSRVEDAVNELMGSGMPPDETRS